MDRRRPVIDFDHNSTRYAGNWQEDAARRLADAPVAWTEAHGGYWVISKYADVSTAAADWETFSSSNSDPAHPERKGISIPSKPYRTALNETDPPNHRLLRMAEAPFFGPKSLMPLADEAEEHIHDAIDLIIERGEADLCADVALIASAQTSMRVIGAPREAWRTFVDAAPGVSYLNQDHPNYPHDGIREVQTMLNALLGERRTTPSNDIASALCRPNVRGTLITDEDAVSMLIALVFAGFGTTVSAVIASLLWLDGKREMQLRLLADNMLFQNAIEEFLRMWPPNHGLARTATRDVEMRGETIRAGDRVYLSWATANRDPDKFEMPDQVRIDRPNAKEHMTFSAGVHKCLGAPLARREILSALRAVMTRMPDLRIDHDRVVRYPMIGNTAGFLSVPATFTPGRRAAL